MIIYGITQNPNWLISRPFLKGKDFPDVLPGKAPNLGVAIDQPIIPVRKDISEGVEV